MNLYETIIKFSARIHDAFTDLFPEVDHDAIKIKIELQSGEDLMIVTVGEVMTFKAHMLAAAIADKLVFSVNDQPLSRIALHLGISTEECV